MTLSFTGKFGISGAWMTTCLFTPEIYPTNIRFMSEFISRLDVLQTTRQMYLKIINMILAVITCIILKHKQRKPPNNLGSDFF